MNALAQQISQMSPLKVALATQQLAPKMSLMNAEPIAVIGMGCRFPGGANNPDLFWQLLSEGRDAVIEIPPERWDMDKYYDADPEAPGKMTVRHGGILKDVDKFDAQFFGISPREAAVLDPQQRLLLEVSWEALENAGIVPATLHGSATGVYVGITTSEYERVCQHHDISLHTDNNHIAYMGTGNDTCAASGRLSYSLGLTGPSLSVNTACSSSLVAAHLACESLRHRTSNLAIAGGVNLTLVPDVYVIFSKAGMLSPGGRCRTFDAAADGYVRGEGCGILILKRYSDAVADGDKVLALIRGSAVNQDGRSSGLTVPNGPSQQAVIRQALKNSGISPEQVSYLEAHGTGTALGDPIEVGAIGEVFGEQREHPLLIGSAKTNIGHLESGAGAAGLIKTILALKHAEIPPSLHFNEPSPHIAWDKLAIKVVTERSAWPQSRRIAGVSSFGYSGTNAHFVLEAAPTLEKVGGDLLDRPMHILGLSAKTKEALTAMASAYAQALQTDDSKALADFCWTANTHRSVFSQRLAVTASSKIELATQLAAFADGLSSTVLTGSRSETQGVKTAFLFTGQGSQYIGMGRELYETQPTFREDLSLCDKLLQPYLQHGLLGVLFAERPSDSAEPELINETAYTQPALFALEYALAKLWLSFGVQPEVMIGHSVGEYAAACIAGVFNLEDGLRLIAARGRLMQALPHDGGMLAVKAEESRVAAAIQPYAATVSLAASNGPQSVVISGELLALQALAEQFKQAGVETRPLTVSHAFHSPLMEPMLAEFAEVAKSISYHAPKIGLVSNLTGRLVTTEISRPEYWVQHVREAVRFNAGMLSLEELGCNVYLEIGPQPTLLGMGRHCLANDTALWLPSLRPNRGDWSQMLESLAGLYTRGAAVDWQGFDVDYTRQITGTPTYPFQRLRHWMQESRPVKNVGNSSLRPLVDTLLQSPLLKESIVETTFSTTAFPYLNDHKVFDEVLVPGAAYIAVILSGAELLGMTACRLEDVVFTAPLVLPENQARIVQVVYSPDASGHVGEAAFSFQVISTDQARSDAEMILHATGHLASLTGHIADQVFLANLQADCVEVLSTDDFYQTAQDQQIEFGPGFRWISGLWSGAKQALAQISLPESIAGLEGYWLHPGLLDACFQAAGATLDESASTETLLPFMLKVLQVHALPKASIWWCHVQEVAKNTWDIKLLSTTGQLLAELSGFEMRNVPRSAALSRKLSNWLYQLEWQAKPLLERKFSEAAGRWLLIDSGNGFGDKLIISLQAAGQSSVQVNSGEAYQVVAKPSNGNEPQRLVINTKQLADFQRLFAEIFLEPGIACLGVIYLAAADARQDDMPEITQSLSLQVLYLTQALAQAKLQTKLWLVTQGAQQVVGESRLQPAQAAVWGFGRTLAIEQPDLGCVCLDLSPEADANQLGELLAELGGNEGEEQVAWRAGNRYAARLAHYQDPERQLLAQPAGPFRLELADYGSPDELHLVPLSRRQPGATEVEIEVKAAALNFRDVLNSLGMLKDYYAEVLGIKQAKDVRLGFECAGTVVAVGADVVGLKPGDEVLAITEGSFASFVTVDAGLVAKKPEHISFATASGIPTVYLTAYYGLYELAKLKAGDKVLIHAAAGGVGQAAVQLAHALGAEVFATASPGKWATLRAQGVKHVMNSRNPDFAEEVLRLTAGAGVDVVLNSLNGEFIDKSFAVLGQGGRFVEIGKIGIWDPARVAELRPDAAYFPFDLGEATHAHPGLMSTLLAAVMQGFNERKLSALPQTVFQINDAPNAYRFMQQAKHVGKVVLSFAAEPHVAIHADSSYIITGGLGALGLLVAKLLAEQGAQHLVLAGRSGVVDAAGQALLDSLAEQGVSVAIVPADVAKAEDVSRLLAAAQARFPVRGVIHAAGVIDDAGLQQQTAEHFAQVLAPKVLGAWHLHKQTQHLPLDFFICFSSIASVMGSPGQCNYSAANAVVDVLMEQRRSFGLPGMSINWGPWAEVGMATNLSFEDEGLDKIPPAAGMQVLADLLRRPYQQSPAQIGVFPINWPLFMRQFAPGQEPLFVSKMLTAKTVAVNKSTPSTNIRQQLQDVSAAERLALLNNYIDAQLSQVLSLDASQSTPFDQHWRELGLDSLMTVELKNRLNRTLGVSIPLETIMEDATTSLLAEMAAQRLEDSLEDSQEAGPDQQTVASGPVEDAYAKNQAALDENVALVAMIPQAYVNVDEQRNRQVLIDGRWRSDFASCNYLGMDLHPDVIDCIPAALDKWGVHPSWTRAVASPGLYPELEQELAELLGAPETLVFPSIHLLHLGVLPMLAGFNGVILKDNAAHHSIYEACLRSQADGVEWLEFAHNDLADLEKKLARFRPEQSKIIAVDGVYSMSGEFPPLPEMSALAKKYNALLYVDDAHGVGVIGANPTEDMPYGFGGSGIVKYFGLGYEEDRIIYVGGLSKSFSSYGAYISCFDKAMKARLSLAGPFIFSGPSPVASLASALAGLKVNRLEGDQMRRQVYQLTHKLVAAAKGMGFEVDNEHDFPIVGVVIGDIEQVTAACKLLWEYDILITPAVYPAVPMHRNLVRFSITAANTEAEIAQAIAGLQDVWDQIVAAKAALGA